MNPIARALIVTAVAILVTASAVEAAQGGVGRIRGLVTDASSAVLPGVTVMAVSGNDTILATAVTDEAGSFVLDLAAPADVRLAFKLDGFEAGLVSLAGRPAAESVIIQRMSVAPVSETVVVRGKQPLEPLLPPLPAAQPVPEHDVASVCGPAKPGPTSVALGTIRARRHEPDPGLLPKGDRGLYTKDDQLIIAGGLLDGLQVGQNVVARRYFRVNGAAGSVKGEHSAGLLQIAAAEAHTATAVVIYACDEIMVGDFLGSFTPEPVRAPDAAGTPAFYDAARVLFGDVGQSMGGPRRMLVIDHGVERGVQVGQRFTIFRREARTGDQLLVVGQAVVVAVRPDSATIRVETATDAIYFGDWAAPQRQPSAISQ